MNLLQGLTTNQPKNYFYCLTLLLEVLALLVFFELRAGAFLTDLEEELLLAVLLELLAGALL